MCPSPMAFPHLLNQHDKGRAACPHGSIVTALWVARCSNCEATNGPSSAFAHWGFRTYVKQDDRSCQVLAQAPHHTPATCPSGNYAFARHISKPTGDTGALEKLIRRRISQRFGPCKQAYGCGTTMPKQRRLHMWQCLMIADAYTELVCSSQLSNQQTFTPQPYL